jgi:hypothetical protein
MPQAISLEEIRFIVNLEIFFFLLAYILFFQLFYSFYYF